MQQDREARRGAQSVYESFTRERTGDSAVASARYGLAFKQANNALEAIASGNVESQRALGLGGTATGSSPASGGGRLATPGGAVPTGNNGQARIPANVTPSGSAGRGDAAGRMNQYAQQSRFLNGRSFYQNGNQWVDATAQKSSGAKRIRIQFNSAEYFELITGNPETAPWLALGQNVQFVLRDAVYEIYE